MPASKAENIRNIVLMGHGGSGKTTLGEAMLHQAKVTSRLGSVDDGTSHLDYSDIEKDRKHTIDPSMALSTPRAIRTSSAERSVPRAEPISQRS